MPLHALIVDNVTTLNGTAPANGAPWNNVGQGNGASVVYLKKGWVVSARHVFGGTTSPQVNFSGTIYSGGTIFVLTNPDNSASDVVLFNIGTTHPASSSEIEVVSTAPTGSSVTMIGYGRVRGSTQLTTITYTNGSANGYPWGTFIKSWASNNTALALNYPALVQAPGNNAFQAFATVFTANGHSGRAQAAIGDSGGGVFWNNNGIWQLAGTMNAIGGYPGQQVDTAASGNPTYIADMAVYASQINNYLDSSAPAPTLTTISPSTFAATNNPQTLTFSGSNFTNGAKIQRALASDPNIDPNNFSDTSPNAAFVNSTGMTLSFSAQMPATWRFRIVNPDGQPSAPITVTVNAQTFSNWLMSYPSLTGNNALETADLDADGLVNLLEYAFGSDPTSNSNAGTPVSGTEVISSQTYLTLTYQKDTTKTDIAYQGQMSTDLTTPWTDVVDTLVSSSGTLQQRKISVLMDGTAKFLRVKIVK